ncbi:hypothetical protein RUM44_006687 [Polyplax serrata]|uniref:Rho GTPase-activating protein 21 n=1 Tax=Polyplax serrata TaxID=468196 RepID=A0ABR1AKJ3_POLSC
MWAAEMGRTGKRRKSCHSETGNFNYILDCSCKKKDGLGFSLLVASDRILSVNGETIAGKTYAQVVQQIHNTPERLNLLVVPKEEDIIQQYYSETAHNPKTNARPRLRSPEVVHDPKRASALSLPGTQRTSGNQRVVSPIRQHMNTPTYGSWQHDIHSTSDTEMFNQVAWPNQNIGSENRGTMEKHRLKAYGSRWSGNKVQTDQISVIKTHHSPGTFSPNSSVCRLSLDGGALDRRESSSSSTLTDDSVIMSRIRKSCEQKEEFLRNTATPIYSQIIAREFYARPQKFQKPVWPPQTPESDDSEAKLGISGDEERLVQRTGKPPVKSLPRIQSNSPQSFESGTYDSEPSELQQPWYDSPLSRSHSEESDSVRSGITQPKLHLVSRRARQFETGQLEEEDRTHFYRSELARLSGKRAVPNVAVRKQEFELVGREGAMPEKRDGRSSVENYTPPKEIGALSGNRTVIVGSKQIHVEPPTDFKPLGPETEAVVHSKHNVRSNSSEGWTSKEGNEGTFGGSIDRLKAEEKQRHKAMRQDSYLAAVKPVPAISAQGASLPTSDSVEVVRREKKASSSSSIDDDRSTRRVSYLKATSNDQMNIVLDKETNSGTTNVKSVTGSEPPPRRHLLDIERSDLKENFKIVRESWLSCKVAVIDGKRAADRSWKQVWAILRGPYFTMQKDKQTEHIIDIRSCVVDIPQNYTKKKNVFRIRTETETEYWLQAEDQENLDQWTKVLEEQSQNSGTSDQSGQKGIKKIGNLRTRSPTGQSPASKTRKATQLAAEQPVSPKSKTWKGKLGKQFRKMQGSGSPTLPTVSYPEGATIKVPIELCPPSSISEFIPLIVERCTSIVEARGLEVVGIYRVPGNTAAVTALTESVNKGMDYISPEDPRWNDVNVISSLLKSFFRNLPDSLFTSELYPKFIEADKIIDPKLRMITLRKLIKELPEHNFETLKHLLYHLKKIVSNSSVNKMETQNLAIVFGPTLLTTSDLMSLVTDTSHQCRIVESLISHVDWFFSNDNVDTLENLVVPMPSENPDSEAAINANLLLGNIHKIEGYPRMDHSPNKDMSPKDIVSSIISAANRKISKGKSKKVEKTVTPFESESRSGTKKIVAKDDVEASTSVAASIVSSFVGEIVRNSTDQINKSPTSSVNHDEVIRAYSGLDSTTLERIKRFEQETHAMLHRDPMRIRRDAENWLSDKQITEAKLKQSKRELDNDDVLPGNASGRLSREKDPCCGSLLDFSPKTFFSVFVDLKNQTKLTQFSSHADDSSNVRRSGSFESIRETTPNGSLKRFKSNKEEVGIKAATSLDSLHERTKSDLSDDGNDLVVSLARTFDKTLKSFLNISDSSSVEEETKSMTEKADYENVIEQESKLVNQTSERKEESDNEEKMKEDESKESKVKYHVKLKEKIKKLEISETVLRAKNTENTSNLKRSESLNRPEKPDVMTMLKRSESLNKSEKENDFIKLKHSDSLKNELKRSDSLTKYEKTETNLNKRKQQESGLKRSSSKEKENILLVKVKRKNGMPDRSIKRRHTVGGTKDFDKMPWLDNRLQSEALESEKSLKGKEKRNLRTSSPDLSSSRLKATIESEGLSIEVSLLGSRGNVLATLRKPLIPTSPSGRPQSMPPVSQIFKLPLESHV